MLLLNKIQCPFMTSKPTIELGIAVNFFTKGRIPNKAKFEKKKGKQNPKPYSKFHVSFTCYHYVYPSIGTLR